MTDLERSSSHTQEPPVPTALQRLTAVVQHQLNNPLAALLAEAQLLRREPALAPEHGEALDRMIDLMRRINGLVRDLESAVAAREAR